MLLSGWQWGRPETDCWIVQESSPSAFKEELAATRVLFTHLFLNLPPGTRPTVIALILPHSHNKTEYHLLKGWPSNLVYTFITDSYGPPRIPLIALQDTNFSSSRKQRLFQHPILIIKAVKNFIKDLTFYYTWKLNSHSSQKLAKDMRLLCQRQRSIYHSQQYSS